MKTIGPYEVEETLGSGGFGTVYRCRHRRLGYLRAVKVINDPGDVDVLASEAASVVDFQHPNIARLYELDDSTDPPYAVFEYVDGIDLRRRLDAAGPLPWQEAVHVIAQVLDALAYAHEHGVVHRDVKPANILIADDGNVKLADFGMGGAAQLHSLRLSRQSGDFEAQQSLVLSRAPGGERPRENPRDPSGGTLLYMSPAQLDGEDPSPADDIYSVGVTLYEAVAGKVPPLRYPAPSEVLTDVPVALDQVVDKALDPEPGRRYVSAGDMAQALLALIRLPVTCPECGAEHAEDSSDHFSCPACGREHLCISHRAGRGPACLSCAMLGAKARTPSTEGTAGGAVLSPAVWLPVLVLLIAITVFATWFVLRWHEGAPSSPEAPTGTEIAVPTEVQGPQGMAQPALPAAGVAAPTPAGAPAPQADGGYEGPSAEAAPAAPPAAPPAS